MGAIGKSWEATKWLFSPHKDVPNENTVLGNTFRSLRRIGVDATIGNTVKTIDSAVNRVLESGGNILNSSQKMFNDKLRYLPLNALKTTGVTLAEAGLGVARITNGAINFGETAVNQASYAVENLLMGIRTGMKKIPFLGKILGPVASIITAPAFALTKVPRIPTAITKYIRTKLGGVQPIAPTENAQTQIQTPAAQQSQPANGNNNQNGAPTAEASVANIQEARQRRAQAAQTQAQTAQAQAQNAQAQTETARAA